jgi:hypothetical protein
MHRERPRGSRREASRYICNEYLRRRSPISGSSYMNGSHPAQVRRARKRRRAQQRLPAGIRQQLLDSIYAGQPFRGPLRDLGLTPNQVWGLTKTDEEWSTALAEALTATRRADLRHGTNACVADSVCKECREHQRRRMARSRS